MYFNVKRQQPGDANVCKYIGKQGEKPAGRWYYSGGDLREPEAVYGEISPQELVEQYGKRAFVFDVPGGTIAVCNGRSEEHTSELQSPR